METTDTTNSVIVSAPRVTYSASRKISDGNYGSNDIFFSYSSDVSPHESPEEAAKRVMVLVDRVVDYKTKKILSGNKT